VGSADASYEKSTLPRPVKGRESLERAWADERIRPGGGEERVACPGLYFNSNLRPEEGPRIVIRKRLKVQSDARGAKV